MPRTQVLIRLDPEIVAELDSQASRERRSRSDLIREAVGRYLTEDGEAAIDRAIVAGYTRHPQEDLDGDWAARESILAEPWD